MLKEKENKMGYFSTVKFLFQFVKKDMIEFFLFYIGWLFQSVVTIITPIIFGIMINQIVYYQDIYVFLKVGFVFFFITVMGVVLYYLIYEMYAHLWNTVNRNFRISLFSHLQKLTMKEFDKLKRGETVNMIQFWSMEGVNFIIRNVVHFINNIVLICGCFLIIFFVNWRFGLVTIFLIPFSVMITKKTRSRVREKSDSNKDEYSKYFSWLFEIIYSISDIRMLGARNIVVEKMKEKQDVINENNIAILVANQIAKEQIISAKNLILLVQYGFLAFFAVHDGMSIGVITALLSFFNLVSDSIVEVVERRIEAERRISIIQSMKVFLDKEAYCITENELIEKITSLEVKNCNFSYGEGLVINNVSFLAKQGETIAIVGESGSGKTTLLNLILGFYVPNSGEIKVNGKLLSELNNKSYYEHVGVVFQNPYLIKGSVRENIEMGTNSSKINMNQAAQIAEIDDEIRLMEKGYDTHIESAGTNISRGQRQRIGIARAMIKDADVMIFDEATSALDVENEKKIIRNWDKCLSKKIKIVVSHRLNVVMSSDFVLMIKEGSIIAQGKPEEMQNNIEFRKLFAMEDNNNS